MKTMKKAARPPRGFAIIASALIAIATMLSSPQYANAAPTAYGDTTWHDAGSNYLGVVFINASTNEAVESSHAAKLVGQMSGTVINLTIDSDGYCSIPLDGIASTGELYELYIDEVKSPREYVFGVEPTSPNMYFIGMKGSDGRIVDACFYNAADSSDKSYYVPLLFADMIHGNMLTEQIGIPLKLYIDDGTMYGGQGGYYSGGYQHGLDEYAQIYLDRFYLYQSDGPYALLDTNIVLHDAVTGKAIMEAETNYRSINTSFVNYDEDSNRYYLYFPNIPVFAGESASFTIKQLPLGTKYDLYENRDEFWVAVTDGLRSFEPMSVKLSAISDSRYAPSGKAALVFAPQSDCPTPSDLRLTNPQRSFTAAYLGCVSVDGDVSDRGSTVASGSVRLPVAFEEYLNVKSMRPRTIPTGYAARLVYGDDAHGDKINTVVDTGLVGFYGIVADNATMIYTAYLQNSVGVFEDMFLVPGNNYYGVTASTEYVVMGGGYQPLGDTYNFDLRWNSLKMDWDWELNTTGDIQNKKTPFPEETLVSMGYDNYLPQADDLNIETIFLNGEPNRAIFFKVTDYEVDPEMPDFRTDALYPGKEGLRFKLFNYPDIANYPEKFTEMDYADEYELDYAYSNDKLYYTPQGDAGYVTFKNAISTEQLLNSDNNLKISMRNSPSGYDIDEDGTGSKLLEYASFDLSLEGFDLQNGDFIGNIESSNPHNLSYSEYSGSTLPMYDDAMNIMGISLDQDYDYTYPYSELVIHVNFDESDGTEYTEDELKSLFTIKDRDGNAIPSSQITVVKSENQEFDYEYHVLVPYKGPALPETGQVQLKATRYSIETNGIGCHDTVSNINMNLNAYGQFYYFTGGGFDETITGYDQNSVSTYVTDKLTNAERTKLENRLDEEVILSDELDTNDIYITLPKNTAPNFDTASSVTTIVKTDFETSEAVTDNSTGFKLYHYYADGIYTQKEYAVFDRNNAYVADGEPATVLYTDDMGQLSIYNLPTGTWYIEEADVPDGYVRNERDKSFTISSTFTLDSLGFACFNGRRIYWEPTSRTFTITPTAFPIMLYDTSEERVETYTYEEDYRLGFYDKNSDQKTYLTLLVNGDIATAAASEANTVPPLRIVHFDSYGDTIKISPTPGQDYTLGLSTDGSFLTTIPVDDIEQLKAQTVVFYNSKILPDPERGMFELPILTVPVSATKVLYGEDLVGNDFEFELYQRTVNGISGNETDELIATASNNAQGAIEFSLVFDETDVGETFTYVMKEKPGSRTDMDYDDTEHIFTISLMNGENGIEITNGSDAGIVFYNTVNPTAIITGVDDYLGAKTAVLIGIPIALALPYVALRRRNRR